MMKPDPCLRKEGFALLATLWAMTILCVLTTSFAFAVRMETRVTRWNRDETNAFYIARAGIHGAAAAIRAHANEPYHTLSSPWWHDETIYRDVPFGEGFYSILRLIPEAGGTGFSGHKEAIYGIRDEESRLNINVATPEMLMQFSGISSRLAEDIVLFRLRAKDGKKSSISKEDSRYKKRVSKFRRDVTGPIQDLAELLSVERMSEEILFGGKGRKSGGVASCLTCYSSGLVNVNTAGPEVLLALGFQEKEVNTILLKRTPGYRKIDEVFTDLKIDRKRIKALKPFLDVRSRNFRIISVGRVGEKGPAVLIRAHLALGKERMFFPNWQVSVLEMD